MYLYMPTLTRTQ